MSTKYFQSSLKHLRAAEAAWDAARAKTIEDCERVLYDRELDNGLTGQTIKLWARAWLNGARTI